MVSVTRVLVLIQWVDGHLARSQGGQVLATH